MTTGQPTAYPSSWRPPGAPPPDVSPNVEALQLGIDAYIAALSDEELAQLLARTRNGGQPVGKPPAYGQPPQPSVQYGR